MEEMRNDASVSTHLEITHTSRKKANHIIIK